MKDKGWRILAKAGSGRDFHLLCIHKVWAWNEVYNKRDQSRGDPTNIYSLSSVLSPPCRSSQDRISSLQVYTPLFSKESFILDTILPLTLITINRLYTSQIAH